jgi:hypothetical protein
MMWSQVFPLDPLVVELLTNSKGLVRLSPLIKWFWIFERKFIIIIIIIRFEVLTAVTMKNAIFLVVTTFGSIKDRVT